MNKLNLPGVKFRSCIFTPTFWRYKEIQCNGLQVHVYERNKYDAVTTGLHLLYTLKEIHPDKFRFNPPTYDKNPHFDYLAGTDKLRKDLQGGKNVEDISYEWREEREKFMDVREKFLLYEEPD
jgi:uncharacterized protein YbbC (DUF1343 family)